MRLWPETSRVDLQIWRPPQIWKAGQRLILSVKDAIINHLCSTREQASAEGSIMVKRFFLHVRFLLFQRHFRNFTNTFLLCPPARKKKRRAEVKACRLQLLVGWLCFYSSGYEAGNAHEFSGSVRHEKKNGYVRRRWKREKFQIKWDLFKRSWNRREIPQTPNMKFMACFCSGPPKL